ncbi:hypothetical protein AB0C29_44700 [Actinoplanes sp. NPDC048791]|uniref:hypothetical protein n=1 Tax=Actinoplanes sp. NPDC048791 TaxID=3154623 RepID=UPI0033D4CCAD
MQHLYARRLLGVPAAAAVLLLTVASPARAGDIYRGDPISAAFPDIEVPVGGTAVDALGPNLWSTGPTKLTGAKVTYDLRGVTGVRLTPREGDGVCVTPSPTRVACSDPRVLSFEGETIEQYLPVRVQAARTATAGRTGTVTITFSAEGLAPITGHSEVRVVGGRETLAATGPATGVIGLLALGAGVLGVAATRRRRATSVA